MCELGQAIWMRTSRARVPPRNRKISPVKRNWMPMTLWSSEKMYLRRKLSCGCSWPTAPCAWLVLMSVLKGSMIYDCRFQISDCTFGRDIHPGLKSAIVNLQPAIRGSLGVGRLGRVGLAGGGLVLLEGVG